MQRLLSYFLLTLFVTTSLYALRGPVDGRYYNRDVNRRTLHINNDGKMEGEDSDYTVTSVIGQSDTVACLF